MGYIICVAVSTLALEVLNSTKRGEILDNEKLSQRKRLILKAIVDAHINHGEPVGSKYLSQDVSLSCSSATIRNEMAELEEMGYLVQPHTSAGRIPSELGYRFYVESIVKQYSATKSEIDEINEKLRYKLTEMDEILREASKLAASFTDYTGIAFKSGSGNVRVQKYASVYLDQRKFLLVMTFVGGIVKATPISLSFAITESELARFTELLNIYLVNLTADELTMPLIVKIESLLGDIGAIVHPTAKIICETMSALDTADIKLEGVNKLLKYPEYSDVSNLQSLFDVLEEKEKLLDVITSHQTNEDGLNVYIGNDEGALKNTALIFKNVNAGDKKLAIGIIGPKRMNYSKVIGMINQLADRIDSMFAEDNNLLT